MDEMLEKVRASVPSPNAFRHVKLK